MDGRPLIVDDIECAVLYHYKNKDDIYCIGSRKMDKYFFVKEDVVSIYMFILKQMDGVQTLKQIEESLPVKNGKSLVCNLYHTCLKCGLIINANTVAEPEFNELKATYKDILNINISGFSKVFSRLNNQICYMLAGFMLLMILCAIPVWFRVSHLISWRQITGDIRILIWSVFISTIMVLFHEASHAAVASKCGIQVTTAKIATFTYVTFACYVRLPGIYFLPPLRRLLIWFAGIFMNVWLIALSILAFFYTGPYGQLFLTAVILSNVSIIISAIMPFYISDGYFILSTICKAPNLRKNTLRHMSDLVKAKKIEFSSVIYSFYFLATIVFTVGVFAFILTAIISDLVSTVRDGRPFYDIILNYINIFIVIVIFLFSKAVKKTIKNKKERAERDADNFKNGSSVQKL